jgi:2-polyprenyl-6-methoxyphenol hydroxylase-like FAD-dependent oxidoreductase
LDSFKTTEDGEVIAKFKDASTAKGGFLVGADGNNSVVREGLKMVNTKLTSLPVNVIDVVRHFTPEQAVPVRPLNPRLFFAMHPETKTFFFFGVQVSHQYHYRLSTPNQVSRK